MRVDGVAIGEVELVFNDDPQQTKMEAAPVERIASLLFTDQTFLEYAQIAEDGWLTFGELESIGVTPEFKDALLEIYWIVPMQLRRAIPLRGFADGDDIPGTLVQPSGPSGLLNIAMTGNWASDADDPRLGSVFDGAISWRHWTLEGDGFATLTPDWNFELLRTRIVRPVIEREWLLQFGDLAYAPGFRQTARPMWGVGITSSVLESTAAASVSNRREFIVERPSTVELFVNNARRGSFSLAPNTYSIEDLALAEGANEVSLIIRDETGRETRLAFDFFHDRQLVQPGTSVWRANIGLIEADATRKGETGAATGSLTYGLANTLTFDGGLQIAGDGRLATGGLIWANRYGQWASSLALSQTGDTAGAALDLNWRYRRTSFPWTIDTQLTYTTLGYAEWGSASATSPVTQVSARTSRLFGDVSFNSSLDWRNSRKETTGNIRASLSRTIGPGRFSTSFSQGFLDDTESTARISYSIPIGGGSAKVEHETDRRFTQLSADYAPTDTSRIDTALARDQGINRFAIGGQASGQRLYGSASFEATQGSDDQTQSASASLSGALVYADGLMAWTRPVGEGFVIIAPSEEIGSTFLGVNRDGNEWRWTNEFGPAVHPATPSFTKTAFLVEAPELDPLYGLGIAEDRLVADLGYRNGIAIRVGEAAGSTVRGIIVDAEGAPVTMAGVFSLEESPLSFTAMDGSFVLTEIKGAAEFKIKGRTHCVPLPEDAGAFIQIGSIGPDDALCE